MAENKNNFFSKNKIKKEGVAVEKNKAAGGEQKKKKEDILKELKEERKERKEMLKEKEKKESEDLRMCELNLEILKLNKELYLKRFKKRLKDLENKYIKAYALEKGIEI